LRRWSVSLVSEVATRVRLMEGRTMYPRWDTGILAPACIELNVKE